MTSQRRVAVVGAGISGLAVAWWLHRSGIEVIVLEKDDQVGGTMKTLQDNGWLVEQGPNSALETTPLFSTMFEQLGLLNHLKYANPSAKKRYILRGGRIHVLPMSPLSFLFSPLWSPGGKLQLLKEPFIGKSDKEESVAEFVARRLGREFLDYAVNPFVGGVFAGNPEELSVQTAFPKLYALEKNHGGLIKGMIKGRKERAARSETAKDRARMFSFSGGMQILPLYLAHALEGRVLTQCRVTGIDKRVPDYSNGLYSIRYSLAGTASSAEVDAVVLCVPARAAANLIKGFSGPLATRLEEISYPPLAEVFLGFRGDQIGNSLDGFGFLVPGKEKRQILGTIWSSSLFAGRAPAGHVALTTFVGGSRQPELVAREDSDLIRLVTDELRSIIGVKGDPVFSRITKWKEAIPQYRLGYGNVLASLDEFEMQNPGMYFCCNYRNGISVGDCVMSSERVASRIRTSLEHPKMREMKNGAIVS